MVVMLVGEEIGPAAVSGEERKVGVDVCLKICVWQHLRSDEQR